jgi:hypothetical protein
MAECGDTSRRFESMFPELLHPLVLLARGSGKAKKEAQRFEQGAQLHFNAFNAYPAARGVQLPTFNNQLPTFLFLFPSALDVGTLAVGRST